MSATMLEAPEYPMWIANEEVVTKQRHTVRLPYDGTPAGIVYEADESVVAKALSAAERGAVAMANLTQYERGELLDRMRRLLERDAVEFTGLVCSESGKPIREARAEVDRCRQTLLNAADEARRLHGEVIPMESAPIGKGRWAMTVREPIGIIGAITPFNFPLNLALHKIAPAFAAGNSVVHKPAENTPLSALRLGQLICEAKVPAGAYNIVTGPGRTVGAQLVRDPRPAMITFTGSVPVGTIIRSQMGLRRVALELGANSSVIIEPDADLDLILPRCVQGAFAHSGQVCISVQNIYLHEDIAKTFLDRFVEATKKLRLGHPRDESTDISSLITEGEAQRVEQWIGDAQKRGGRVLCGGTRRNTAIEPCILEAVPDDAPICCKEVFGPVVVVHRYSDLDDAIRRVNSSEYGLQAGLCTRDLQRAFQASRKLQVGGVMVNDVPTFRADHMPYGGVKNSGTGREGPRYAIEEMTEMKLICWRG